MVMKMLNFGVNKMYYWYFQWKTTHCLASTLWDLIPTLLGPCLSPFELFYSLKIADDQQKCRYFFFIDMQINLVHWRVKCFLPVEKANLHLF